MFCAHFKLLVLKQRDFALVKFLHEMPNFGEIGPINFCSILLIKGATDPCSTNQMINTHTHGSLPLGAHSTKIVDPVDKFDNSRKAKQVRKVGAFENHVLKMCETKKRKSKAHF